MRTGLSWPAHRPGALRRAGGWAWLVCAGAALVLAGVVHEAVSRKGQWRAIEQARAAAELHQQARQAATIAAAAKRARPVLSRAQIDAVNDVVDRLNVPWKDLFDELEALTPPDVAVLQLEPRIENGTLQWQVEVRSRAALFEYLDRLQTARHLTQAHVLKFEVNPQQAPQPAPSRFVLEARLGALERGAP